MGCAISVLRHPVSQLNIHDLSAILRNRLPNVWVLVTEMGRQTVDGWLPGDLWEYVNDPQKAWSRKLFKDVANAKHLRHPVAV